MDELWFMVDIDIYHQPDIYIYIYINPKRDVLLGKAMLFLVVKSPKYPQQYLQLPMKYDCLEFSPITDPQYLQITASPISPLRCYRLGDTINPFSR